MSAPGNILSWTPSSESSRVVPAAIIKLLTFSYMQVQTFIGKGFEQFSFNLEKDYFFTLPTSMKISVLVVTESEKSYFGNV